MPFGRRADAQPNLQTPLSKSKVSLHTPVPKSYYKPQTLPINAIVTLVLGIKTPSKLLLTMRVIKVTKTILFLVILYRNFLLISLGPTGLQECRNHRHYAIPSLEFF